MVKILAEIGRWRAVRDGRTVRLEDRWLGSHQSNGRNG